MVRSKILTDLNDSYFLKNCFVCEEVARPDQEYIRNYGGIACFSCRAFWRRAHLHSNAPQLICKKNGECKITVSNRKKCKKCRYERCKASGMTQDAILDDGQKKQRFRKMLEKRKNSSTCSESSQSVFYTRTGCSKKRKTSDRDLSPDEGIQSPESVLKIGVETMDQSTSTADLSSCPVIETPIIQVSKHFRILEEKMNQIGKDYEECFAKSCTREPWSSEYELTEELRQVLDHFKNFAFRQRLFCTLESNDQKYLLKRNSNLFLQLYILSEIQKMKNKDGFNKWDWIKSVTQFLGQTQLGDFYKETFAGILQLCDTSSLRTRSVLTLNLLFEYDNQTEVSSDTQEQLNDMKMIAFGLARQVSTNLAQNMEDINSRLENAAIMFSAISGSNTTDFEMPYTEDEEKWIEIQVNLVEDSIRSIPIGKDLLHEFIMFSLSVPPSRQSYPNYISVEESRMRKILQSLPEVQNLSSENKKRLIDRNTSLGVSMLMVKIESSTGYQQLKTILGTADMTEWEEIYEPVLQDPEKIVAFSIKIFAVMTKEEEEEFLELTKKVSSLCTDYETNRLSLLAALTRVEVKNCTKEMEPLLLYHQRLTSTLQRRQLWMRRGESGRKKMKNMINIGKIIEVLNKISNVRQKVVDALINHRVVT